MDIDKLATELTDLVTESFSRVQDMAKAHGVQETKLFKLYVGGCLIAIKEYKDTFTEGE